MKGKRKQLKGDYVKASTDILRFENAIINGGKLEVLELWNNTQYWFNHIEGGRERITKNIFNKLTNN